MTEEKSASQAILDAAKEKVEGQQRSPEAIEQLRKKLAETAEKDHMQEAAAFTEEIIRWLNEEWNTREFTPEQRIFSIALATINLRQHFPADRGGKDKFDAVSASAWTYYKENV